MRKEGPLPSPSMNAQTTTGKPISVYLAAEHCEWWDSLPVRSKSEILAEAIRRYRNVDSDAEAFRLKDLQASINALERRIAKLIASIGD